MPMLLLTVLSSVKSDGDFKVESEIPDIIGVLHKTGNTAKRFGSEHLF
jgi:hypothetical protein